MQILFIFLWKISINSLVFCLFVYFVRWKFYLSMAEKWYFYVNVIINWTPDKILSVSFSMILCNILLFFFFSLNSSVMKYLSERRIYYSHILTIRWDTFLVFDEMCFTCFITFIIIIVKHVIRKHELSDSTPLNLWYLQ